MTIGIIGAMEEEIVDIKESMDVVSAKNIVGLDFYMGTMYGNSVVLVRSGIGKVNAAICTQVLIDLYAVDYIINTGVAGAISRELNIGDVVISSDTAQHDFDTTACGDEIGIISRMDESFFKADEFLVELAQKCTDSIGVKSMVGRVASGDKFVSDLESKNSIWNNFKALCCDMEGAAIAQACYLNRIPFVIVRCISDRAEEEDEGFNFREFAKASAVKAAKIVTGMIENLK